MALAVSAVTDLEDEASLDEALDVLKETALHQWWSSSAKKKSPAKMCNGWTPKTGKWKGTGGSCRKWGWTRPWCYVEKNYKGPGKEFIKPSKYTGKYYAPCQQSKTAKM